jgi:hypothetical protein
VARQKTTSWQNEKANEILQVKEEAEEKEEEEQQQQQTRENNIAKKQDEGV